MTEEPSIPIDPERSEAAAILGKKGGASGTGEAKKRDPRHYGVILAEARNTARMLRKMGLKGESTRKRKK